MIDTTKTKDNVKVTLRDKDGKIKQQITGHNLVVTTGLNHIADQLASSPSEGAMSHMAVGTGTNAVTAGDTALQTELNRQSLSSRTADDNTVTYVANWGAGTGTGAITEYGIFNAASDGVMLARFVDDVINKGANDTLQVEWEVTISDGS